MGRVKQRHRLKVTRNWQTTTQRDTTLLGPRERLITGTVCVNGYACGRLQHAAAFSVSHLPVANNNDLTIFCCHENR